MADSTAIAIVSVSVAGITAVATPVLSAWLEGRREERRFAHELRTSAQSELRALLDDATIAFDDAFASRAALTKTWMQGSLADCAALIDEVQSKRNRTVVLKARLETRLGRRHAVPSAYDEAIDRLDDAVAPLVEAYIEAKRAGTLHERPAEKVRIEAAGVIKRAHSDMNDAMNRFTEEAHKLAGFTVA